MVCDHLYKRALFRRGFFDAFIKLITEMLSGKIFSRLHHTGRSFRRDAQTAEFFAVQLLANYMIAAHGNEEKKRKYLALPNEGKMKKWMKSGLYSFVRIVMIETGC